MLFLESELTRLSVWANPLNSMGHGYPMCFVGNTEKSMLTDVSIYSSPAMNAFVTDNVLSRTLGKKLCALHGKYHLALPFK